jgi:hypothetical protein
MLFNCSDYPEVLRPHVAVDKIEDRWRQAHDRGSQIPKICQNLSGESRYEPQDIKCMWTLAPGKIGLF